ncbi:hydroxyproline dehydrogenase [Sarracenia purpurea var. burkii]
MAFMKLIDHKGIANVYHKNRNTCYLTKNHNKIASFSNSSTVRSTVTSATAVKHVAEAEAPRRDPLDLSFANPEAAFKSKTTWEVLRAYIVYQLCSSSYLVDNNMKLMKFGKTILGEKVFASLMKSTFYGHFVAGEDQYKIVPTLQRLRSFGVKPILDYSVEEDITQEEAEKREVE